MSANPTATAVSPALKPAKRRFFGQELGLLVVVLLIGAVLGIYGWYDAPVGRPNTFLNPDNLIDGIATPMSYYAIMAVGLAALLPVIAKHLCARRSKKSRSGKWRPQP